MCQFDGSLKPLARSERSPVSCANMDQRISALSLVVAVLSLASACRAPADCGAGDASCSQVAWLLFTKKRVARFVFGTNTSVAALRVNPRTGAVLTNLGSFAAGTTPDVLAVDPAGKFLYCANSGSDNITAYSINETSGVLTSVQTLSLTATSAPAGLVVFSDFLLVSNRGLDTAQVFRRDATTGMLTGPLSSQSVVGGGQPRNGMVHPNGRFIYLALEAGSFGLARITATGSSIVYTGNTALSGGGTNLYDAAMTYDGRFIVVAVLGGGPKAFIYSVDSTTGGLTEVSTHIPTSTVSHGIVAHPYLPVVYFGYDSGSSNIDAFQVSNNGALTLFSTATMVTGNNKGLSIDPQGGFLYTVNTSQGFALAPLNPATGAFSSGTATAVAPAGTPVYTTIASYYDYLL